MLGMIIKHELKATSRVFVLLYGAFAVITLLNAFVIPLGMEFSLSYLPDWMQALGEVFASISSLLYLFSLMALSMVTLAVAVVRFYRLLGNEGYLWLTLPVPVHAHILGKLIPAFIWSASSVLLLVLSLLAMIVGSGNAEVLRMMTDAWMQLISASLHPGLWVMCLLLLTVASWLSAAMSYYAAMAIGPSLTKSRLGGSILAYLIIWLITRVLNSAATMILSVPLSLLSRDLSFIDPNDVLRVLQGGEQALLIFTLGYGLYYLALAAAGFLLTRHQIAKRLNLA